MDILSVVRQATITGTAVKYDNGFYIFSEKRFHEGAKTSFRNSAPAGQNKYYELKDVIFFLENVDSGADYKRKAHEAGVGYVVSSDQVNLKNYLIGKVDTCEQIDVAMIASTATASQSSGEHSIQLLDIRSFKRKSVPNFVEPEDLGPDVMVTDRSHLDSLRADEIILFSRKSVLNRTPMEFGFVIKLVNDNILRPKDSNPKPSSTGHSSHTQGGSSSTSTNNLNKRPRGEESKTGLPASISSHKTGSSPGGPSTVVGTPIILVPNSLTAVISSINVFDFIAEGTYRSIESKKAAGAKRVPEQLVNRQIADGSFIDFKVIDDPRNLRPEDWEKVVAVFVLGQLWQFKAWKWENPADLFQHVLGVHVTLDDRAPEPTVLSWNCQILKINQFKRHLDAGAVNEFWGLLEDFIRLNKPWVKSRKQNPTTTSR